MWAEKDKGRWQLRAFFYCIVAAHLDFCNVFWFVWLVFCVLLCAFLGIYEQQHKLLVYINDRYHARNFSYIHWDGRSSTVQCHLHIEWSSYCKHWVMFSSSLYKKRWLFVIVFNNNEAFCCFKFLGSMHLVFFPVALPLYNLCSLWWWQKYSVDLLQTQRKKGTQRAEILIQWQ